MVSFQRVRFAVCLIGFGACTIWGWLWMRIGPKSISGVKVSG